MAVRDALDRFFRDRVILAFGWVLFLVYAYPGYMSYDSAWQLVQARHIEPRNEWHPPLMAFLWHFLDAIIAGPFLMLVLQSVVMLCSLYIIFKRVMSGRAAAITAVVILLIPQNIVVMAVIWKDSQMVAYLLGGIAGLLSERWRGKILGCLCIFLATGFRYNAAAACFPIVLLLWDRREHIWWLRRYATAVGVWVGITILAFVVNAALTERKTYPWPTSSAGLDIVGTIRFSPHLDNDQLLKDTEGVPWIWKDKIQIRTRTTYAANHSFLDMRMMEPITTDEQRKGVTRAWKKLVFAHPGAFLRHRIGVLNAQLESRGFVWAQFTDAEWSEDALHHRGSHSSIQKWWVVELVGLTDTWIFHIGMYFFLALALLPLCRGSRLGFVLIASAICHELGLFLVAPAVDYRYSHWMIVATLMGAIILFATRRGLRADGELRPRATRPTAR